MWQRERVRVMDLGVAWIQLVYVSNYSNICALNSIDIAITLKSHC